MKNLTYILCSLFFTFPVIAQFNPVERASIQSDGNEADEASSDSHISSSADGRYVVFTSDATDLVVNDTNDVSDVFLHDRTMATTIRISVSSTDEEGDGASSNAAISADGLFIVYQSDATNLIVNDTNASTDIFLYDIANATTTRVSVDSDEEESDGNSMNPSIDGTGAFIAFASDATNLVANDTNAKRDIFLRNVTGTTTVRISERTGGTEATDDSNTPSISSDGTKIAFISTATDLIATDTNNATDIFLHDTDASTTVLVSKDDGGIQVTGDSTEPVISPDGTVIAYSSVADDIVTNDMNGVSDVFVYTIATEAVERVSIATDNNEGDGASTAPSLSTTGRYVSFISASTNLVTNDENGVTDVFVHDRTDDQTVRVSVEDNGSELLAASSEASINSDGHYVSFTSSSDTLVANDTNSVADIFVIDTQCLVEPDGITPLDTDSDGTDDCADECAEDDTKIAVGQCGCGVSDTDTDSDGTADCLDNCVNDPEKTLEGLCGCGESDADENENGLADCLDPTGETVPRKPVLRYLRKRRILRVIIPEEFPGFSYQIQVRRGSTVVARRRTRRTSIGISGVSGTLRVRYRIRLIGGGRSKFSRFTRVRTR